MRLNQILKTETWPAGVVTTSTFAGSNDQGLFYDVRSGSKTPGYNHRVAHGPSPLPVNPYTRTVKEGYAYATGRRHIGFRRYASSTAKAPYDGNNYDFNSVLLATPASFTTFESKYSSERNNNIIDSTVRLKNHIDNVIVNAPVELAEGKESALMVLNRVKDLVNYTRHFNRKNERAYKLLQKAFGSSSSGERKRALKSIASDANGLFLEFNFGWAPLYGLFGDAASLLAERLDKHAPRSKMTGSSTFQTTEIVTQPSVPFHSPLSTLGTFTKVTEHAYTHKVWQGGILSSTTRRESLSSQLGFTLSNTIPTLWELVRASFIVDYFVNVGDVLANLKNSQSELNASSLFRSEKWEYECRVKYTNVISPTNAPNASTRYIEPYFSPTGEGTVRYMIFTRTQLGAGDLITPFRMQSQSWDHIVKTLSVAVAMTHVLK